MIGKFPKKQELRRQKVLKSKKKDELYDIEGVNQVYRCFELVGIHEAYCNAAGQSESFAAFYDRCIGENRKHHYQNKGTAVVNGIIKDKRIQNELIGVDYTISRKSMSRYGLKKYHKLARVYESSAVVLKVLLEYIFADKDLTSIYQKNIKKNTMAEYFTYQNTLLGKYNEVGRKEGGFLVSKNTTFAVVRNQLATLIGDK